MSKPKTHKIVRVLSEAIEVYCPRRFRLRRDKFVITNDWSLATCKDCLSWKP